MTNPASKLANLRRRVMHKCAEPECGVEFEAIKIARYCSNACRQRAKYKRSKSVRS